MPASKAGVKVRFKVERANEIAAARGLTLDQEKAEFFGISQSNYSRVITGQRGPGDRFIAAVLASNPGDPDITFDELFEIVPVTRDGSVAA